jgi:drug/metabolite transporter (DMT)-like permease
VTEVRLGRVFWIGAAAILIVAALVAVAAILHNDFGETDAKILGTLSLLLAGSVAISGYALVERRDLVPLGWSAVVSGAFCFMVIGTAIWDEFGNDTLDA